ncbi:MAG: iron ABC transporter permease [Lachnospiraceae bacterium]|nr:iron ABC transporter permease [Lachnospiraceae bacterium]
MTTNRDKRYKRSVHNRVLLLMLLAGVLLLLVSIVLSITYGAKQVELTDVISALFGKKQTTYNVNVVRARIPRTVFGILAGAALSMSGVLMQSITRNPIADPSILGVNTGASLFVVIGISLFHIQSKPVYMLLAFAGALVTAFFVYRIASFGYGGVTPIKLALAGAAVSTALSSMVSALVMPDTSVMTTFRFWQVGSIGGADFEDIRLLLSPMLLGFVLCFFLATKLNTLALGDETACALGLNVNRIRGIAALIGVLLCACTTALAGPIGFIGLMIPHLIRSFIGDNHEVLLPMSALYGSGVLILSDLIGRILGSPGELESGVMTALIGVPCFVFIIRKAEVQSIG